MSHYQHILLAVDLFDHSEEVALKAVQLAKNNHAKLSIIHVIDTLPFIDVNYESMIPLDSIDMSDLLIAHAKQKLTQLLADLKIEPDSQWLEIGSPKTEITRIAKEQMVDLIVIGSHGRHGLALLLGSTANAVLHYAKCDVLAVRLKDD